MRLTRSKARNISEITIDQNIDMNSYGFTELGNLTMVKNSGLQTLTALGADGDWCGQTVLATAGEAVDKFETVYLKSDGKVWLSDADAVTTMPIKGIAIADVASGASGIFLIEGFIRKDAWDWTPGAILYAHTTGGAIGATAPSGTTDLVQRVGIAVTADIVWFKPELTTVEVL